MTIKQSKSKGEVPHNELTITVYWELISCPQIRGKNGNKLWTIRKAEEWQGKERRTKRDEPKTGAQIQVLVHLFLVLLL